MSTPSLTEPQQVSESDQARRLRNGLVSLAILVLLIVGLLLAVPGLHVVGHLVAHMNLAWVGAGVLAEILSCLGYVLIFLTVFDRAPIVFGARVALTEMAFGAAVSLGGAGSIAVGAWLLRERGMATGRIAERSAVLFLLTSAINLLTLAGVGLAMGVGILPGPRNPLLTLLPAGICIAAFVFFLALPRLTEREAQVHPKRRLARVLHATGTTIRSTRKTLLRPDWRLLGAIGYLWFDIGVLWACFQAIGHTPPIGVIVLSYQIGYLVKRAADSRQHRRARGQFRRHAGALRSARGAGGRRCGRLPCDRAVDPSHLGNIRLHPPAPLARSAHPAPDARGARGTATRAPSPQIVCPGHPAR